MKIIFFALFSCSILALYGQIKVAADDGRTIRIPVVFHVLYSNTKYKNIDTVFHGSDNINDSFLLKELHDLSLDFMAQNEMSMLDSGLNKLVGNPNIQFYLLDTMLQEKGSKGVRRVFKTRRPDIESLLINPERCLNIVVSDNGNNSNILGDRVNLTFYDVGHHYHVASHETGHWLGLYHVWGQVSNCGSLKTMFGNHDDLIEDTPEQRTCTDVSFKQPCPPTDVPVYKGKRALYNNFMDYSNCRCMFTVKQAIQMRNNVFENMPGLTPATKK